MPSHASTPPDGSARSRIMPGARRRISSAGAGTTIWPPWSQAESTASARNGDELSGAPCDAATASPREFLVPVAPSTLAPLEPPLTSAPSPNPACCPARASLTFRRVIRLLGGGEGFTTRSPGDHVGEEIDHRSNRAEERVS